MNKRLNNFLKLDKETKEEITLNAREILLFLVDGINTLVDISDGYHYYRKTVQDYRKWRNYDKRKFTQSIYRLKRQKFIKVYFKGKKKYIELSKAGKDRTKKYLLENIKPKKYNKWDQKWRIVIFDIPENKKTARNILRGKLKQLGFFRIQKSVFIFPYECKKEIDFLKNIYDINKYVQYIIADRVDTEINVLKHFYDQNIIN